MAYIAGGLIVIFEENGHDDLGSNPGQGSLHSFNTVIGISMHRTILLSAVGK